MQQAKLSLLALAIFFSTHISCMKRAYPFSDETSDSKIMCLVEQDSPLAHLPSDIIAEIASYWDITTVHDVKLACRSLNNNAHYYQIAPENINAENIDVCTAGLLYFAQTHAHNIKNNALKNNPTLEANFKHLFLNNPDERKLAFEELYWSDEQINDSSLPQRMLLHTTLPDTRKYLPCEEIIYNPTALRILASINPNITNEDEETLFYCACRNNNTETIKALLDIPGIEVNRAKTTNHKTPLYWACKYGNVEIVQLLLTKPGINANTADDKGRTPLHCACDSDNMEIVQSLLKVPDIDSNISDNKKRTPLHVACNWHNKKTAQLLLKTPGIDVNREDYDKQTPLHIACNWSNMEIVQLLLTIPGIDTEVADNDGQTPLHIACYRSNMEIVQSLLSIPGINAKKADDKGRTPLHLACKKRAYISKNNDLDIVIALLNTPGINVNEADDKGKTPLHLACKKENIKTVIELLNKPNININTPDNNGQSPLDIAKQNNDTEIIQLLTDHQSTHSQK